MNTTPMYIAHNDGQAYCQYCLEGIAGDEPGAYTLREREPIECCNCKGEHTPEARDYYIVEECKPNDGPTMDTLINDSSYCDVFGVPLKVYRTTDDCGQPFYVTDAEDHILDFFSVREWMEICTDLCRQVNGRFVINW